MRLLSLALLLAIVGGPYSHADSLFVTSAPAPQGLPPENILFATSWNTATGSTLNALTDGGTWASHEDSNCAQTVEVLPGPLAGNNMLQLRTCGTLGFNDPNYEQLQTSQTEYPHTPDLYVQFYFLVRDTYIANENMHWFMIGNSQNTYYAWQFLVTTSSLGGGWWFGDFAMGVAFGTDEVFYARNTTFQYDTWYRIGFHIEDVPGPNNSAHMHLWVDGVNLDDVALSVGGVSFDQYLDEFQASNTFQDTGAALTEHTSAYIASYQGYAPLNDGLSVCCIEFRSDQFALPVQ